MYTFHPSYVPCFHETQDFPTKMPNYFFLENQATIYTRGHAYNYLWTCRSTLQNDNHVKKIQPMHHVEKEWFNTFSIALPLESVNTTGSFATAATWAIPVPSWPAPTTPNTVGNRWMSPAVRVIVILGARGPKGTTEFTAMWITQTYATVQDRHVSDNEKSHRWLLE